MDTRTSILNAAAEVFAQHGFRGSTTRRIADAASVNEVTIFRYFGSKDALLQEAISACNPPLQATPFPATPTEPENELTEWCGNVLDHLRSRRSTIRKCMGEIEERPEMKLAVAERPTRASNELCAYFRSLKQAGLTVDAFDETAAAAMLIGALFHDAMGREMMPDVYPKPASRAPRRYARLLLRAIGVRTESVTTAGGSKQSSTPPALKLDTPEIP